MYIHLHIIIINIIVTDNVLEYSEKSNIQENSRNNQQFLERFPMIHRRQMHKTGKIENIRKFSRMFSNILLILGVGAKIVKRIKGKVGLASVNG